MEWYWAFALLVGMVVCLMALGGPRGLRPSSPRTFIGIFIFAGVHGFIQVVDNSTVLITRFTLGPVPMFILMGALFFHTGLAIRVFDGLDSLFGKLRGRLCYLTVAGGTIFSTLTGSSHGQYRHAGVVAGAGDAATGLQLAHVHGAHPGHRGLAMIIPPSALAVLLASVANIDVGRLLIAGFLPGFVPGPAVCRHAVPPDHPQPRGAPAYDVPPTTWVHKIKFVTFNILPVSL